MTDPDPDVDEWSVEEWSGAEPAELAAPPDYVAPMSTSRAGVDLSPAAWGALYAEHYTRTYLGPLDSLVIHHTASSYPASAAAVPAMLRSLEAYGHARDGADVEYHALISWGLVAEGYAPRYRGCHCTQPDPRGSSYNTTSLGVALIGYYWPPYDDPDRPDDLDALARWVAARVADGDLTEDVFDRAPAPGWAGWYGHKTTGAATACPGTVLDALPAVMDRARALYEGDDMGLTPDEHFQLQSLYQQNITVYEPGANHEGLTPRWALDAALLDSDVERIAARVVEKLTQATG